MWLVVLIIILIIIFVICALKNNIRFTPHGFFGGGGYVPLIKEKSQCPLFVTGPAGCGGYEFQDYLPDTGEGPWGTCSGNDGNPIHNDYLMGFCQSGMSFDDVSQIMTKDGMWYYRGLPLYIGYNYMCNNTPCTQGPECINCYKSDPTSQFMGSDDAAIPLIIEQINKYKQYL